MFGNAVDLYQPINRYKPFAEQIGTVDGPVVRMRFPGLPLVRIPFPTRMTVVTLPDGTLWLHSPTEFDAALAGDLQARGRIGHLVAPSGLHYVHLRSWSEHFPEAVTWAPPGIESRLRGVAHPPHFQRMLDPREPAAWQGALRQRVIPGKLVNEVVFFHIPSATLILTDTIENFELDRLRNPLRFLVRLTGAYHPHGQMPIDLRSTFHPCRMQIGEVVRELLSWQPERIIVSHGRLIEQHSEEVLRHAFRWTL